MGRLISPVVPAGPMSRADVVLLVLGGVMAPLGVILMSWETCLQVIGGLCVGVQRPYEATGLAVLVAGILLFAVGLVLLATRRQS